MHLNKDNKQQYMFQALPQIERLSAHLQKCQKQHQTLQQSLSRTKASGKVQKQVSNTIDDKISKNKYNLALCEQLQVDVEEGNFINGQFMVEDLVYDVKQLPQWFSFVFQKQFEKQRDNFSALAKRLYKQQNLHQKKVQLANQIKSFQNLHLRYRELNETERGCININSQAQTFENKCKMLVSRFVAFLQLMAEKVVYFVEENVQKSLAYSSQINNFAQTRTNFDQTRNNFQQTRTNFDQTRTNFDPAATKQPTREYVSVDKGRLRSTQPSFKTSGDYYRQRVVSPGRCLHHPTHVAPFPDSRFNYRQHLPKWTGRTLTNFYM